MLDVENLVEETAYMEAEAIFLLVSQHVCILVVEDPAALRESELELVAVVCGLVRRDDRRYFRNVKMTDADELIINLLLLGLKLHFVWKRLPFATSTNSEMLAERLKTMF